MKCKQEKISMVFRASLDRDGLLMGSSKASECFNPIDPQWKSGNFENPTGTISVSLGA